MLVINRLYSIKNEMFIDKPVISKVSIIEIWNNKKAEKSMTQIAVVIGNYCFVLSFFNSQP
jgi:hypothetical protein